MKRRPLIPALLAAATLLLCGVMLTGCTVADASPDQGNGAAAADAGRSWAEIKSSGVLKVGTITDYPPNETKTDDGKPTGWAVELVGEIAAELGLKADYQLLLFDNILPRIKGGVIDLGVGSFTDTKERQQSVDFVNYYRAGSLWAAKPGSTVTPDNACGLTIAVMTGGTQYTTELPQRSAACVKAGKKPIEILPFVGQPEVTDAVLGGRAAAFSADSPVTIDAVNTLQGKLAVVGDMFDTAPYGFPLAKGSELAEHVRGALQRLIDDGRYEQLLKKYHSETGAVSEATINAGEQ